MIGAEAFNWRFEPKRCDHLPTFHFGQPPGFLFEFSEQAFGVAEAIRSLVLSPLGVLHEEPSRGLAERWWVYSESETRRALSK